MAGKAMYQLCHDALNEMISITKICAKVCVKVCASFEAFLLFLL